MSYSFYHLIHLLSLFVFIGIIFSALSAPHPENRRRFLIISGVTSLLVFISGFGLVAKLGIGFPGWTIVKIVCWLILSIIVGQIFRQVDRTKFFGGLFLATLLIAVVMVSLKPF